MTLLFIVFSVLFSCSKDSDLLLNSVLNDPEVSLDEKNRSNAELDESELEVRSFTFSPTNDAYMQDEQGHDKSIIRLQEDYRTSYLMFDLNKVNGRITEAVLQFSVDSDEGDGSILVYKGLNADWTEEDLNQNNAPGLDSQLGSMNKAYKVGTPEKVSLNTENLNSELTTLVMTHNAGNDLAFASKENSNNKGPKLIITYKAPIDSPLIGEEEAEEEEEENTDTQEEDNTQEDENNTDETDNTASTEDAYYVTINGKASNDGRSESSAWSLEHAFDEAIAGDIIYIKAGDYGSKEIVADNSGTAAKPIKFIGYEQTPGDIVSSAGSTFKYGDQLNAQKMPLIRGANDGTGIFIPEDNVQIHNFQITKYRTGLVSTGANVTLLNVVITELGNQSSYNAYDGFGLQIKGDKTLIENCIVINATAEAIKLSGSNNSRVNYCSVYADNPDNPTDYYFLLTGGTTGSIVENSYAERQRSLRHGGHGFDMKDLAENNTFKNCTARNTNFELNFSGVRYNTIEDCKIYGIDTSTSNWHAVLAIWNGANNNLIKNMYIQDTWRAINWGDDDDGYVGPGGDRDEVSMGYDNTFDGIVVRNTNRIINSGAGKFTGAKASGNTFKNCDFSDFDSVAVVYFPSENIRFQNCKFENGNKLYTEVESYSNFDVSWENCQWTNVNFTPPN